MKPAYSTTAVARMPISMRARPLRSGRIVAAAVDDGADQPTRRREARAVNVLQVAQGLDHRGGREVVDHTEGTAAEGRKSDPEQRPDVAVAGRPHHAVLQRHGRLVEHREHPTPLD